jgi:hypothetical protein
MNQEIEMSNHHHAAEMIRCLNQSGHEWVEVRVTH